MPHFQFQLADNLKNYSLLDEDKKLKLIKDFEKELESLNLYHSKKLSPKKDKIKSYMTLRKFFYYFLVLFGLIEDAIGSYLFGYSLFSLIPGLSNPLLLALSIGFALLQCVIFYGFEATLFKQGLGIEGDESKDLSDRLNTLVQQLNSLKKINKILKDNHVYPFIPVPLYQKYAEIALIMNKDMNDKRDRLGKYQETPIRRVFRWGITAFGALTTVAGSYFMATSLLAAMGTSLALMPICWLFVALLVAAGLGFYFAMQAKSMINLVNPEYKHYKEYKHSLKNFESLDENDVSFIATLQQELNFDNRSDSPLSSKSVNEANHTEFYGLFFKESDSDKTTEITLDDEVLTVIP